MSDEWRPLSSLQRLTALVPHDGAEIHPHEFEIPAVQIAEGLEVDRTHTHLRAHIVVEVHGSGKVVIEVTTAEVPAADVFRNLDEAELARNRHVREHVAAARDTNRRKPRLFDLEECRTKRAGDIQPQVRL